MKRNLKEKTVVISATSLILSGLAYAEVMQESGERPFSWNFISSNVTGDDEHQSIYVLNDHRSQMSIRSAQQTLNDLGYSIEVDGIAGPETKEALRDFQAANGIAQTEKLDAVTVTALRDARSMDTDRTPAGYDMDRLTIEGKDDPEVSGAGNPSRSVPR